MRYANRRCAPSKRSRPTTPGLLAATTAFGKTVVGAALIAHRGRNTLILVHRRELLKQWVERLTCFLGLDPKQVGTIGGGKRKPTGVIDVALIQSLARNGEVDDIVTDYGHLIVDECHHLSAASFERVAGRTKARYVTGLSATVARKDGHHPIIFMQCGPVRHRVHARVQAAESGGAPSRSRTGPRGLNCRRPLATVERPSIPAIYAALAQDSRRNGLIFDDVLKALEAGRSPLVLTERKDHLDCLAQRFCRFVRNLAVLRGGLSAKDRRKAQEALNVAGDEERLILATGRYVGEGFDDARLDTLFLTMPIAWKGTLAQYVGRLHRRNDGKNDVLVVDYVDEAVPVLDRMAAKRRAGYPCAGLSDGVIRRLQVSGIMRSTKASAGTAVALVVGRSSVERLKTDGGSSLDLCDEAASPIIARFPTLIDLSTGGFAAAVGGEPHEGVGPPQRLVSPSARLGMFPQTPGCPFILALAAAP